MSFTEKMNETKEKLIRKIENKVLDKNFLNFELIKYQNSLSIPHLLKVYGDIVREIESNDSIERSDFVLWKSLTLFLGGLDHCIRWVVNNSGIETGNELSFHEKDKLAIDFLCWGKEYNEVAQQFVAWSRKLIDVDFSLKEKYIEFIPPVSHKYYFTFLQDISSEELMNNIVEELPYDLMSKEFNLWIKQIDIKHPPIQIDWSIAIESKLVNALIPHFAKYIFPGLRIDTNLGNYTLNEYLIFYSVLFANFSFITSIEDSIDSKTNLENEFGSNPICLSKIKMISFLVEITRLTKPVVMSILNDLTFNTSRFHSQLINKPFILSREGNYYVLPRIFNRIDPKAMLLGVLTKGDKVKTYSHLINQIEKENLNHFYHYIKKSNPKWIVLKEQRFTFNNQIITPDIVIFNQQNKEVLILEYKNLIPPYSASDTDYKLKEVNKGKNQINKYINYFTKFQNNDATISRIQKAEFDIYAILLFKDPMPIPIEDFSGDNMTLTDINTFKKANKSNISIKQIFDNLKKAEHVDYTINDFFFDKLEVKVGGWKFIRSILAAN